jgi:hypothetical protein
VGRAATVPPVVARAVNRFRVRCPRPGATGTEVQAKTGAPLLVPDRMP